MNKRKCRRCRGAQTLYNTDGRPVLCPSCGGSGEEDANAHHLDLVSTERPRRADAVCVLHRSRAL